MKKLFAVIALTLGVGAAFGQGTVNFRNNVLPASPDALVHQGADTSGPLLFGANYSAELYYQDAQSVFQPVASSLSNFRADGSILPGTWSGKTVTLPAGVGGVGVPLTLQVRVWDNVAYTSYAAAVAANAGGFGSSTSFGYTQLLSVPPSPTDTYMTGLRAFGVTPLVPEPATILLGVLGAGALLLRRRK